MANNIEQIFTQLSKQDQATLQAFAEFLLANTPAEDLAPLTIEKPAPTVRPDDESVIKAIRRLSESYFMVDRDSMLNETSNLMTAHIVKGKPAAEVVDDLEALFELRYRQYVDSIEAKNSE
ncbi:MAG: Crp/Fnr family transcriptional regulator [Methylococcales bacterium]|jgi:hypothetical protein|nr:Crp/Fnr family transcriptional regulator [Methylococcales bacterium]MBT7444144.1 Crp/Fnr family transcriptional regulator [Methylococcales bacterium]